MIGAIDGLETGRSQLFISHAGDSQTSVAQEKCLEELKNKYLIAAKAGAYHIKRNAEILKAIEGE